jgi:hypothetical protein
LGLASGIDVCLVMVSLVVVMGFVVVLSLWAGGRPLGGLGV